MNIKIIQKMLVKTYMHILFSISEKWKAELHCKIPITIKMITTTATIIPIISLLPVVFLKVMKYNIHTPAFINVWQLCISLFTNNMHVFLLNIGICISFVEKSLWCYMYCTWLLSKKKQITYFIVTQKIKINFSYNANIQRIF